HTRFSRDWSSDVCSSDLFDSLADLVAFGVAPALLVYYYLHSSAPEWAATHKPLMIASLSVYVLCAALRLARYNAVDADGLRDWRSEERRAGKEGRSLHGT